MVILGSIIVPFLKIVVWFTLLDLWLITCKSSVQRLRLRAEFRVSLVVLLLIFHVVYLNLMFLTIFTTLLFKGFGSARIN